ncbi:TetR family transcriptional regulator [Asanoa ferruginea]|uniref:TetR family transcriptional regulator n=1 Tax=Asanoa ferruginea TaxID=53367 RepID=A0A3D9ZZ25_9ACTN|nr:TetR/AcrR family transcriptional regulator C-terminal domain-containing protein [Asanoa ferruginea]REG01925.1 TetR family transcriptional regulator [Asanoa ferruginea]GIF49965.1 transcriptional regulator [Asanoa ferruginea]
MTDVLPPPPWKKPRRAPSPAREPLSADKIVDAAFKVLDAEGLDAVSMRRVADELNTGAASLYAHVANKEELLELIRERVLSEIQLPEPDPARWQQQLREVASEIQRAYANHRDIARLSLGTIPVGYHALRMGEGLLAIMLAGGVPPNVAALATDRIALYVAADSYEGALIVSRHGLDAADASERFQARLKEIHEYYRTLPRDKFPSLTTHVDELIQADSDERFAFGLDMLIRSLATYTES